MKPKELKNNTFTFPHWSKVAKTYSGAVQVVLDEIQATRPFYNWRAGQIDEAHLRETPRKVEGINNCTKKGVVTVQVQMGEKYKGKSVKEVRTMFDSNEFGLGAYEVCSILLAKPDLLKSYDDLWMDCPGDEFDDTDSVVRFAHAPCVSRNGGGVRFGTGRFVDADAHFGSASATLPSGSTKVLTSNKVNAKIDVCPTKQIHHEYTISTKELGQGVTIKIAISIEGMEEGE